MSIEGIISNNKTIVYVAAAILASSAITMIVCSILGATGVIPLPLAGVKWLGLIGFSLIAGMIIGMVKAYCSPQKAHR